MPKNKSEPSVLNLSNKDVPTSCNVTQDAPVLFIRPFEHVVDTKELVSSDEISSLTKGDGGKLVALLRENKYMQKLRETLKEKPCPPLSVPPKGDSLLTSDLEDTVLTDSVIESDVTQKKGPTLQDAIQPRDLEWQEIQLQVAKLPQYYMMLSKIRLTSK